jgi:sugar diacid utilization regulator
MAGRSSAGATQRPDARRSTPGTVAEWLTSLGQIADLVNSGTQLPDILQRIAFAVCQQSEWSTSAVMAVDEASGFAIQIARHDPNPLNAEPPGRRWPLLISPTQRALAAGGPIIIEDAQNCAEYPGFREDSRRRGYRSVVLRPLQALDEAGRPMVMSVHGGAGGSLSEDELAFLRTAAQLASLAVVKAQRLATERQHAEHLRRALDVHVASMEHVLGGQAMAGLVALAQAHLADPLLVVDLTTNQAIGQRSPVPHLLADQDWQSSLTQQGFRGLGRLAQLGEPSQFSSPVPIDLAGLGVSATLRGMVEPCTVDGLVLGAMVLFTGTRQLEPFEVLVAEEIRFALSVLLMRAHVKFATRAETLGEFFNMLFSGNWRDRAETLARAGHLGLHLEGPTRLVVVNVRGRDGAALVASARTDIQRVLSRIASAHGSEGVAFHDGEAFLLVLSETSSDDGARRRLVSQILKDIEWLTGEMPTVVLGRLCRSLEDFAAVRHECARLLDLAGRIDRRGLVADSDFGPLARLLAGSDRAALRAFLDDNLGRIEAHDGKHRSSFLKTLEAFLAHSCRYQATADALGVHITTLRYRLRRVTDLFGIDPLDPETRLSLEMALRVRSALGAQSRPKDRG